jgi:hypothetical protein
MTLKVNDSHRNMKYDEVINLLEYVELTCAKNSRLCQEDIITENCLKFYKVILTAQG